MKTKIIHVSPNGQNICKKYEIRFLGGLFQALINYSYHVIESAAPHSDNPQRQLSCTETITEHTPSRANHTFLPASTPPKHCNPTFPCREQIKQTNRQCHLQQPRANHTQTSNGYLTVQRAKHTNQRSLPAGVKS
jgi:hypothetical protein